MRILVHGIKRRCVTFTCRNCGCIYQENTESTMFNIGTFNYTAAYKCDCPECGCENVERRDVSG